MIGKNSEPLNIFNNSNGAVLVGAIFSREISDQEMLSYYTNPWQIFAPPQ